MVNTPLKPGSVRNEPDWIGFGVVGACTAPTVTDSPTKSWCGTVVVMVTAPFTVEPEVLLVRFAPLGLAMSAAPPAVSDGGKASATTADAVAGPLRSEEHTSELQSPYV